MSFYVYLLLDPRKLYTPFYVGKGSRRRKFTTVCRGDNIFKNRVIQKIKQAGHRPSVLIWQDGLSEGDAHRLEMELIQRFGRRNISRDGLLVNLTDGGEGTVGCPISEEQRTKISLSLSGEKNPMYGRSHSVEARRKISVAALQRPKRKLTDEHVAKLVQRLSQHKHKWSSPVYQIDSDGLVVQTWPTCREASISLGMAPKDSNIAMNKHDGCHRQVGGFYWRSTSSAEVVNGRLLNVNSYNADRLKKPFTRPLRQVDATGRVVRVYPKVTVAVAENEGFVYSTLYKAARTGALYRGYFWRLG